VGADGSGPAAGEIRHDWTVAEIRAIHDQPLLDLIARAGEIHRRHHDPADIQRASLLSIKTGGCPENCTYCAQSAHWKDVPLQRESMMDVGAVLAEARAARDAGAGRFCMGAAWREVRNGPQFDAVLEMVKGVRALGMEACVTLGMLNDDQARRLKEAGLTAYNHNLDTSRAYYDKIVTTRTYDDRLRTLNAVRAAGIEVCCGGIVGLGETVDDRVSLLQTLATLTPHPESVPINALAAIEGTPLQGRPPVDALDMVRMCATARIVMPKARVRLSAGRRKLSREAQVLCFLAGANSIFYGEKLLTTANSECEADAALFQALGLPIASSTIAS
jgi:biotin synthase